MVFGFGGSNGAITGSIKSKMVAGGHLGMMALSASRVTLASAGLSCCYYCYYCYTNYVISAACSCNVFGSEREDCEQTTGQCVCKHHVTGRKCDTCTNGRHIGPRGCTGKCNALLYLCHCCFVLCIYLLNCPKNLFFIYLVIG